MPFRPGFAQEPGSKLMVGVAAGGSGDKGDAGAGPEATADAAEAQLQGAKCLVAALP
jgi:hypothetical protein